MTRRSLILSFAAAMQPPGMAATAVEWLALQLDDAECAELHDWPTREAPICLGSLLKPFLVVAYGVNHPSYPLVHCFGMRSRCWHPAGHGVQTVVAALANSCNAYFLSLAAAVDRAALDTVCLRYGLQVPDRALTPGNLIGLSAGWPQSPERVARAFAALAANGRDPHVGIALSGMARCANRGTARAAGFACYAKTGTAPCSHAPRAPGDGFALAIYPPGGPRHLLLVARHGATGALAALDLKPLAARFA